MNSRRFAAAPVLARLKDFQRRTVDTVFQRLYLDDPPARRFLVADEVGLGKTMVARGVIARAIEHLHGRAARIDVVYVCSNTAIAAQNIRRLNVSGSDGFALASRLTLLPTQVHDLAKNPINFISFTPGTTFDPRSREGIKEERALLYRMLRNEDWLDGNGLRNLLQCQVAKSKWRRFVKDWDAPIDPSIAESFQRHVRGHQALRKRIVALTQTFHRHRQHVPRSLNDDRLALVAELRHQLSLQCLSALKPDLVILDEFQRFRDLLDGQDDAATLARALFDYPSVHMLLLSATPYKMLTLDHEQNDDHYPDFLRTLGFLFDDTAEIAAIEADIQKFRGALYSLASGSHLELAAARDAVAVRLRRVMCRTERVAMTRDRDAMVIEPPRPALLQPPDLAHARLVARVARAVGAPDTIEYWKSSPYLLSFLRHYELRRRLDAKLDDPPDDLLAVLRKASHHLLDKARIERYEALEPANARMRMLFADTLDRGLWRVLWMPPSMPYTAPSGAFAEVGDVTKSLVFSAWSAVPDAIAALCSYEAERRMLEGLGQELVQSTLYDRIKPLLSFTKAKDGRLNGMPALMLLLPSPSLASLVDPLALALEHDGGAPASVETVRVRAESLLMARLAPWLPAAVSKGGEDHRWYWAAPLLLDAESHPSLRQFCTEPDGWITIASEGEERPAGFRAHLDQLVVTLDGRLAPPLGRPPRDLGRVLADLALAGPGVCALRALGRMVPQLALDDPALLKAAACIASGLRTLFNLPESIALLRGTAEDSYWRLVLGHCLDGNLQAVLDEQVHVLQESLGLLDKEPAERTAQIGEALSEALSLRTAQLRVDQVRARPKARRIEVEHFTTRCRFALRFGKLRDDKDSSLARADTVRVAFNSPFRPFVLASTSVGQEGLDFHTWCHAVVHWNLPANPVDLEQREGRVHRYKGHAVRKNIARRYGLPALRESWDGHGDPWAHLFERAAQERPAGVSDLVPYWIFEIDGGACVERRVPLLPFSKEVEHLRRLKRSLALYRLVFGQPRQEDLLTHLSTWLPEEEIERLASEWTISLVPDST